MDINRSNQSEALADQFNLAYGTYSSTREITDALAVGKLLAEARRTIGRDFSRWIEERPGIGLRQAQVLIKLAASREVIAAHMDSEGVDNLSLREASRILRGAPSDKPVAPSVEPPAGPAEPARLRPEDQLAERDDVQPETQPAEPGDRDDQQGQVAKRDDPLLGLEQRFAERHRVQARRGRPRLPVVGNVGLSRRQLR